MTTYRQSRNCFALVAVCLSALMLGLEITSIPSILPTLEKVLSADFQQLQWIMNAYTIAMCSVLMAMGTLGDRFGRKRVFKIGIAVFAFASLICGLATSAPLLIAARFVQGTSAAAMLACQVAVLSHQFQDGAERGKAFGWWGIVFGVGLGFGPIVGGMLITLTSWHWVFLVHVVIAVATVVFAQKGVEESVDPHATRIDMGGMATLSLAVFGIVYLITQGQQLGPTSPRALTILAISAASFLLFVIIEIRVARPMFDFGAFRVRRFAGAIIGSSGMNFSFWPFVIYLPIYLQAVLGYDAIAAGMTVLAYTLPTIVVPPLAERLLLKWGPRLVIPVGLLTIGAGFMLLVLVINSEHASWMTLLPGCALAGIGLGLTNTPVTNTATGALPLERSGMASGMDMSARMISLSINIALMGLILSSSISGYILRALPHAPSGSTLRTLADIVSAGNLTAIENNGISLTLAKSALSYGIGRVALYGAISAFILALVSFTIFGNNRTPLKR